MMKVCRLTALNKLFQQCLYTLLFYSVSAWLSTAFAAEKLTVLLDWFINPSHAPLFVAANQGYFKEQGLDVTFIGPADPADPPKLVAAGKADIAITYEPQLIQQIDHGLPLIRIGTLIDKPLDCLVTLKSSHIDSIQALSKKRIGYSSGGTNSVIVKTMLENHQLQLNNVELINVHYGLSQALLSKKVDAISGVMRMFEVFQIEQNHQQVNVFYPEQNGVPTYDELVFVVNNKQVNDPRFAKFLLAVKKGNAYLQSHSEPMWNQFKHAYPEVDNELNHRAWQASLTYFKNDPAAFNPQEWLAFATFLEKNNLIKSVKPIHQYTINIIKG